MENSSIITAITGSEINTGELVTNLVAATREPRQKTIDAQKKKAEVGLSSTALLKGALTMLQNAATEFGSTTSLNQVSVSSSNTEILTGSAGGNGVARAGNYAIKVLSLAEPQRRVSKRLDSDYASTAHTLTFSAAENAGGFVNSVPNTVSIPANASPSVVALAINESKVARENKIRASVIDQKTDPSGSGPLVIVIEGRSGSAFGFDIASSLDPDELGFDRKKTPSENPVGTANPILGGVDNDASDAQININNVQVNRPTNIITDAISGLTINLKSTSPGTTVNVAVSPNSPAILEKAKNFVESYNTLFDFIKISTGVPVPGDEVAGSLQGDVNARSALQRIRSLILSDSSSPAGDYTRLSSIGIEFNREGRLQIDEKRFNQAFSGNSPDAITMLSANSSSPKIFADPLTNPSGVAGDIARAAYLLTKSSGSISQMAEGWQTRKDIVDKKQQKLDEAMERLKLQYEQQFDALNSVLAAMKNTQSQLDRSLNLNNND